jgi:hypothetical protein
VNANCVSTPARCAPTSTPWASRAGSPFPKDLRISLRHSTLLRATQGIAQETDLEAVRPVFSVSASRFQHPWRMLTLMSYGCALGLSEDRALAALAEVEPDLRELCRGEAPSVGSIRRFRNQNRNVITGCVGKLLRHVWCHHHGMEKAALNPLLAVEILCEARARIQRWEVPAGDRAYSPD